MTGSATLVFDAGDLKNAVFYLSVSTKALSNLSYFQLRFLTRQEEVSCGWHAEIIARGVSSERTCQRLEYSPTAAPWVRMNAGVITYTQWFDFWNPNEVINSKGYISGGLKSPVFRIEEREDWATNLLRLLSACHALLLFFLFKQSHISYHWQEWLLRWLSLVCSAPPTSL